MSKMFHFPNYSRVDGDVRIELDLNRLSQQYEDAQFWFDGQIMNDMVQYMPMYSGMLIDVTRAQSAAVQGTGKVYAAYGAYGRFQYMGKVMVDPDTGSPWARAGVKKVVTDRDLVYSNPQATAMWFDTARDNHGETWVRGVKKRAGGG